MQRRMTPENSCSVAVAAAAVVGLVALRRCCRKGGKHVAVQGVVPASRELHPLVTAFPSFPASPEAGVSVATFNILTKAFGGRDYGQYVPRTLRDWETHRLPLLHANLANLSTDIIAVQEACVLSFATDIAPFLSAHGYGLVAPYDKDAVKKGRGLAKPAILYRHTSLQLLWSQNRSRTVLASFRHRATGNTVYVINCHLEGNPVKAKERFQQLRGSLNIVKAHWQAGLAPRRRNKSREKKRESGSSEEPVVEEGDAKRPFVVVAGDFNSSREHCVYRLLTEGSISPDFTDSWGEGGGKVTDTPYTCPFPLKDAYAGCKQRRGTYLANSAAPTLIDFIFVSPSFSVDSVRAPYTEEQFADALRTGVPNAWWVSDHFALAAALSFPPSDPAPFE